MTDSKKSCDCVKGVGCDVYNCKYNDRTDKCCIADHIEVQNKTALNKSETYCGTFSPRTSL